MKIVTKNPSDLYLDENDGYGFYEIEIDEEHFIGVYDCSEPEDLSLNRNLNFVYSIVPALKKAHEAGARGEPLEIADDYFDEY